MNKYRGSVFLFDIDGVLVEPRGYRQAMISTLKWLFPQDGLSALLPTENEHSLFEAMQITSEWDMVAICSILIAGEIVRTNPDLEYPENLYQWRNLQYQAIPSKLDYQRLLSEIAGNLTPAENPSASFYASLSNSAFTSLEFGYIERLPQEILEILLTTRNILLSPTSALFQNYSLGSQEYQSCYNIQPVVPCESLLLECDRTLISAAAVNNLWDLYDQGSLRFSAMTARPSHSLPTTRKSTCSPPEAEMALKLVGLNGMPVIGLGTLEYAVECGLAARENLLKPAPFHALSALLAALGFSELEAVQAAAELTQAGQSQVVNEIPDELNVVIFEDTAVGIRSIIQAASRLAQLGKRIKVHNYGISQQSEKVLSLENAGAQIFPNTDAALQAAIHVLF